MSARAAAPDPIPPRDTAYFLDIDGTLVDLEESPGGVRIDPGVVRLVESLHDATGGALAVISGRAIPDIDELFRGVRLPAAGQHGVERRDAEGRLHRHAFSTQRLARVRDEVAAAIAGRPGLSIEDKGLSLALHYRRAPRFASFVHRLAGRAQRSLGAGFCVQRGKRVVEVKPAGKDKGLAVREFMREAPFRGRIPVFIGDDITDEYGFATVNRLRGRSVKVGPGPTVARWRLRDVRAVRAWLARGIGQEVHS